MGKGEGNGGNADHEMEEVKPEIRYEPTTEWYKKSREHIMVDEWRKSQLFFGSKWSNGGKMEKSTYTNMSRTY